MKDFVLKTDAVLARERAFLPFIEASCKIYNVSLFQEYMTSDIQKMITVHSIEICNLSSHIFFRHLMMKKNISRE